MSCFIKKKRKKEKKNKQVHVNYLPFLFGYACLMQSVCVTIALYKNAHVANFNQLYRYLFLSVFLIFYPLPLNSAKESLFSFRRPGQMGSLNRSLR